MVVATEDNTTVDVYYSGLPLPDEQFILHKFQVFTKTSEDDDFTGARVVADKPVSVYSGSYSHLYWGVSGLIVLIQMLDGDQSCCQVSNDMSLMRMHVAQLMLKRQTVKSMQLDLSKRN